ncbi:MAG: HAD hydrolase-like protein, partial [Candidatus Altiarchaeota archaeon]|nr:HAD hydrolase-like protein [Candidatus Altiarchaeota archaeon]
MLKALIFDLDGTLVDLLDLHWRGFKEVTKEGWGLDFLREDVERHYGKTAEDIARAFFEKHGVGGVDYKEFARKRRNVV